MAPQPSDLTNFLRYLILTKNYSLVGLAIGIMIGVFLFAVLPPVFEAVVILAPKDNIQDKIISAATTGETQGKTVAGVAEFVYRVRSDATILAFLQRNAMSLSDVAQAAATLQIRKKIVSQVLYPDPFVKITYKGKTPSEAEATLLFLLKTANEVQKKSELQASTARTDYLQKKISTLYDPVQKGVLVNLLHAETLRAMSAEIDPFVSIEVISPVHADHRRDFPHFYILLPLCAFIGLLGSLFLYHLRQAVR